MEVGLAVLSFKVRLAVLSFDWPREVQVAANGIEVRHIVWLWCLLIARNPEPSVTKKANGPW